jgi:hypothetical protein
VASGTVRVHPLAKTYPWRHITSDATEEILCNGPHKISQTHCRPFLRRPVAQLCVKVPFTLVRRSAQENVRTEIGRRNTEKSKSTPSG